MAKRWPSYRGGQVAIQGPGIKSKEQRDDLVLTEEKAGMFIFGRQTSTSPSQGRNVPEKKKGISITEEGNEFEGEHLSFPGQGAWRGPPSSHPTSPSLTPSPSSSSSSSTASQSGRDFRGSGESGAIVVKNVFIPNSTFCAKHTQACHITIMGGKTPAPV